MRGDSLRDLYAKTLALLGLGLLAGAGALVDYWPVSGDLPTVESSLALPAALVVPPPPSSLTPVAAQAPRAGAVPVLASATNDVSIVDAADTTAEPDLQLVVPEPAIVAPPSLLVASASAETLPASVLELLPPVITASEAMPNTPVPAVASTQNGDNRFTGAAKSIGRAGARAGGAVASGFAAMAGAVSHLFRF